jgi:signal transduction histidine kinase
VGRGKVDITVHADDDQDILIDTIGPDAYFGEMAFLGETTRTATIRTRTACYMLEIDHTAFESIVDASPGLLRRLLRQVIGHLRRNDRAVINELNIKNAALRRAYANLAEQEQLRTQFIATLSHELRTPLTSIRGFLNLMSQGAMKEHSLSMAMNSITRNVEKMVGLTNDLLLLYEMEPVASEYALVNVAEVIMEALSAAREVTNRATTAVTLDTAAELGELYADKEALVLAIRAIIENAIKFNPAKAPITIKAGYTATGEVAISVRDRGIGIPSSAHGRIFEPFFRLEQEGGSHLFPGLGVGLPIAKFIVSRHHGRIEVESRPGAGSNFTIFLPTQSTD